VEHPEFTFISNKSNLETREENVKLHTEMIHFVNIVGGNDSKPYLLGGDFVSPNNGYWLGR